MRSGVVEVLDIFRDTLEQLPFAQDKIAVQTLTAQAAQETFAHAIRARRGDGCVKDFNPSANRDSVKGRAIFAVIIADKKPRAFIKRGRLPQLLRHLDLARMACNRHVHHPP